jgi:hypothetical protein
MAPEFIAQHPELPWADMRDMRNAVIHAYFNVDLKTVWRTVQEDLPKLKQHVDHLLGQSQPGLAAHFSNEARDRILDDIRRDDAERGTDRDHDPELE